jgi:CotH protein/lamin tail-like protein
MRAASVPDRAALDRAVPDRGIHDRASPGSGRGGSAVRAVPALLIGLLLAAAGNPARAAGVVINEIHYHPSDADGRTGEFVELYNAGPQVMIEGYQLQGAIRFTFPPGAVLAAGGYVVVAKDPARARALYGGDAERYAGEFDGSLDNSGERIELFDAFNASRDVVEYDDKLPWHEEADGHGSALTRLCATAPGDDPLNWGASPPSPGSPNPRAECPPPRYQTPAVVISEIYYHPPIPPIHAATDDGEEEEFVELHNPGGVAVDISGYRLADGVVFKFPDRTIIPPGEYLVVARDEDIIRSRYGIDNVVGNFGGLLANSGERVALVDAKGQWVDSVRYLDTDPWPYAADGKGPSLEKVALTRSGNDPASWRSSVPSPDSFQMISGEGGLGQGLSKRVYAAIDGPGEVLVDDITLEDTANPGQNLLQNGSFDAGLSGWSASGLAAGSTFSPSGGVGGSGALRLISAGPCLDDGCGPGNGVSASLPSGLDAQHTYRVTVEFRYVSGSPFLRVGLVGGAVASFTRIATPGRGPGEVLTESPPFIDSVSRFPREPRSTDRVWLTARVRAKSPPAVTLTWKSPGLGAEVTMADDGLHHDGEPGDGVFGAELPSFPHNSRVLFRVRATLDGRTAESPIPQTAGSPLPEEWWGFYVNDNQPASVLPIYQMLIDGMEGADPHVVDQFLSCDFLHPGAFAIGGDLYPGVNLRLRGNTACYVAKKNLRIGFNRGRLFNGVRVVNLNGMYTDKAMVREHSAWELSREIGVPYLQTDYIRLHVNGQYYGLYLQVEHPDQRFLQRNGLNDGGNLYKADEPPATTDTPIGISRYNTLADYRKYWSAETNQEGDYTDLADFINSMHQDGNKAGGPTAAFWQQNTFEDMVLGYQVGQVLLNNIDSFAKNHYLYHDLSQDRWGIFAWDLDLTFGKFFDFNAIGPGRPVGTLNDQMLSDLSVQGDLTPWFGATTVPGEQLLNYLVDFFFRADGGYYQRAYLIRLWDLLTEKYSNRVYDPRLDALRDFLTEEEAEDHQRWHRYPSNVPGFPEDMASNVEIVKRQIKLHRDFLRNYIQRGYPAIPSHPRVKITEVMYWPEGGGDQLEFIEFKNLGSAPVDISGWSMQGVTYTFPPRTMIPGGGLFLLARSPDALALRYAGQALPPVFGPFEGKLANEGEELRLIDAGPGFPATIDYLRYGPQGQWPTVEPGHSIELLLTDPDVDNDDPKNWVASADLGGSPGRIPASFIRGDANSDEESNMSDVVFLLSYLYLSGAAPACLDSADMNDDAAVDLTDAVYLLNYLFLAGPPPPAPYPGKGPDLTPDDLGCGG